MKYSDEQRIAKICETTEKLLNFVEREQITPERIFEEEPIQWAVTTPLYISVNMWRICLMSISEAMRRYPGKK